MAEKKSLKQEIRAQTVGYILAGFGLVAGLAWNEAIKALIDEFIKIPGSSLVVKFLYAGLVTLITVLIATYLGRLANKKE